MTRDRVTVFSCDHPGRVNAGGVGTEYVVRTIERGDSPVASPNEAVRRATCVVVESGDHSARIDAAGFRECGARWIERGEGTGG